MRKLHGLKTTLRQGKYQWALLAYFRRLSPSSQASWVRGLTRSLFVKYRLNKRMSLGCDHFEIKMNFILSINY